MINIYKAQFNSSESQQIFSVRVACEALSVIKVIITTGFFLESALLSLVLIIVGLPQIEIDIKEILAFNVQTWLYVR